MAKVRKLSDIQQEIAFTEFDFYHRYEETFKSCELGRIKSLLPFREMAISFGLQNESSVARGASVAGNLSSLLKVKWHWRS